MQLTVTVIVLLAFGLAVVEALRAWLPATAVGTFLASRGQSGRTTGRLLRFGEARTIASAEAPAVVPFRPRNERTALDPAPIGREPRAAAPAILQGFGATSGSPSIVRIDSPEDVQELARGSAIGDLWLRLSDFDTWPERRERREALVQAIAAHPEWEDRTVYEAGIALVLWADDGAYSLQRPRNRKRVRRLREIATADVQHIGELRRAEHQRQTDDIAAA